MRDALALLSLLSVLAERSRGAELRSRLTVELEEAVFGDACFRSGCGQPSLQLRLRDGSSERSVQWLIDADGLRLSAALPALWDVLLGTSPSLSSGTSSSFPPGPPSANASLSAHIVGVDATYRFPRVCDSSQEHPLGTARRTRAGERAVLLSGGCFNASVAVERLGCCGDCDLTPHCAPQPRKEEPREPVASTHLEGLVPAWVAVVLGLGCVVLFVGSLLLLSALLGRGRRKARKYSNAPSGMR